MQTLNTSLFDLDTELISRSITFENLTDAQGQGGKASSPLGVGRKGDPVRHIQAGESVTIANIDGPGMIRHIWLTTHKKPALLRGAVIRIYWDDQEHPGIEVPLGDFFGFAHAQTPPFESAVHSVSEKLGMNIWLPMPFAHRAHVEICNESEERMPLFFQIDYTLGDVINEHTGYLHVSFQRQNPTSTGSDLVLLQRSGCKGRYLGAVMGVRPLDSLWWGEGEMKVYLDGDSEFATIVGTGAEDYVGLSWGIQQNAFQYHGANWRERPDDSDTGAVSMYRWHIQDPIWWRDDIKVTIQQIGHRPANAQTISEYKQELYERQDDWSVATFWYEPVPSAPLPPFPNVANRLANLDELDLN